MWEVDHDQANSDTVINSSFSEKECWSCVNYLLQKCQRYTLVSLPYREFTVSHCSGCHEPIEHSELIQKSGSLLYHLECFHCIVCGQQLNTGDEYYLLNDTNKLVCKMDFETAKTKGMNSIYMVLHHLYDCMILWISLWSLPVSFLHYAREKCMTYHSKMCQNFKFLAVHWFWLL